MEAFATALLTISAAAWVGAIVFQSAVVAPAVFADLDADSARRFLRTLFPRLFKLGILCGLLMGAAALLLAANGSWSSPLLVIAAATGAMLVLEVVSLWLVPLINAARDAGAVAEDRFARLHRASVLMTVIILLLGLITLGVIGVHAATGLAG
jgi:amino acid transporter